VVIWRVLGCLVEAGEGGVVASLGRGTGRKTDVEASPE
jgi:hypothetical protein